MHIQREVAVKLAERITHTSMHRPQPRVVAGLATLLDDPEKADVFAWRRVADGMEHWEIIALRETGLIRLQAANNNPDWANGFDEPGGAYLKVSLHRFDQVLTVESLSVDNLDSFGEGLEWQSGRWHIHLRSGETIAPPEPGDHRNMERLASFMHALVERL